MSGKKVMRVVDAKTYVGRRVRRHDKHGPFDGREFTLVGVNTDQWLGFVELKLDDERQSTIKMGHANFGSDSYLEVIGS